MPRALEYEKLGVMTIAAPTNLHRISATDQTITLAWDVVPGATSYRVHNANNDAVLAELATAMSFATWTDTGLNPNTGHNYYVTAGDGTSWSVPSAILFTATLYDKTPPSKPAAMTAIYDPATGAVKLAWGASVDDWPPPAPVYEITYDVYRGGGGSLIKIGTVRNPTTAFVDTAPLPGVKVAYFVWARDFFGNTTASDNAWITVPATPPPPPPPDTTPPAAPTGLAVAARSASVTLTWNPVAAVDLDHYVVSRNGTIIATPTGTTYTDNAVPFGVLVSYSVVAVDHAGNISLASAVAGVP